MNCAIIQDVNVHCFLRIMRQSFVITALHLPRRVGDSKAKEPGN